MELQVALERDRALRRERVLRGPLNPLEVSEEHLLRYYRLPRAAIQWQCNKLKPDKGRDTDRMSILPIPKC